MSNSNNILNTLSDLLIRAKEKGADACDVIHIDSTSIAVAQRLGKPEKLERSESVDIGLRVVLGKSQAIVSSSDISPEALEELSGRAVAMARSVPKDPYCGLADPEQLVTKILDLESCDPTEPTVETLVGWANRAENAAREVKGVTNSEGAEANWGQATISIAASNGFSRSYSRSHYSLSTSVVAGDGLAMERDYDYSGAVHANDLRAPEEIGKTAGENAVRRLNPKKVDTSHVPVIFDDRAARSLISHFASAINGSSVARDTSFLKDMMGQRVFAKGINIIDDPHRLRGLRSKPFDGEGLPGQQLHIIEDGRLTTWFLDLRSARQLKLEPTGHASRNTSSPPSPTANNLYIEPGRLSPSELINEINKGFYVTELIGFGVNGLTGDYSRGASGFWIENGEITYPVSEVTIAGNLKEMFGCLTPANDLQFRYGIDAPTIRIDGLTVAGK